MEVWLFQKKEKNLKIKFICIEGLRKKSLDENLDEVNKKLS